jgi:hypothetical protein
VAVTSVGTPTLARATTGTVTATWGTGQVRTQGDLLIAAVTATSDTALGMITCTLSGKWALRSWVGNAGDTAGDPTRAVVAVFWTTAWGSDTAPIFNVTPASGNVTMTVTMFELAGTTLLSDPFDTIGWYQSGLAPATITSMSANTNSLVTAAGEYAISVYAQTAAAATNTWNAGSGWTNAVNDGATSSTGHSAVDFLASPTAGSALSETTPHWTTGTTAYGAGLTFVIYVPIVPSLGYPVYQQNPTATVTSGGTTAPSAGTVQTLTVTAVTAFPAASSAKAVMTSFHAADPGAPSELFLITTSPGSTGSGQSWTAVRGAEGTTPVTHAANFTLNMVGSPGDLGGVIPVYNVRAWPFNAPAAGGYADTGDYTAIQAALNAATANGGGIVYVPPGIYVCAQTLQIDSNTTLMGAGMGLSVIRQSTTFNPSHVGGNQGLNLLITDENGGGINIGVKYLTFDGNQNGTTTMPGTYGSVWSYCLFLNSVTKVDIEAIEVINSIGYAVMLQNCEYFAVSRCRIVQGQDAISGYNQQDGIHMTGSRYGTVTDNDIDTGIVTLVGDDCICCQSVSADKPCTDITIKGNVLRGGTRAVSIVLAGGPCQDIDVTGNSVYATVNDGFIINYGVSGSPIAQSINFTGNILANVGTAGVNCGINLQGVNAGLGSGTGNGWADVTIAENVFYNLQANTSFGIAATGGNGLTITGNIMDVANVFTGMLIGNNNAGASSPVTGFTITGNYLNMSASTGSSPNGITIQDGSNGTISGNTLIGGLQATSTAVMLWALGTPVSGVAVTGNRISGWVTGVQEKNSGAAPDYNTIRGNNFHGCTSAVIVLGGHTLSQPNVIDVGGIEDTEQFVVLSANYTLANVLTAVPLFNATAAGALTVAAATTYFFEAEFDITGLSGSAHTISFTLGGTATYTSVKYVAHRVDTSTALATASAWTDQVIAVATVTALTAASVTTTIFAARMRGVIRVNAAGTVIPQISQLTASLAAVVSANSWIRLWPAGSNTVTSFGNWG